MIIKLDIKNELNQSKLYYDITAAPNNYSHGAIYDHGHGVQIYL